MNDIEDIFKSIIAYLKEEVTAFSGSGVTSRINYYIDKKNNEKGDTLLDNIREDDSRYVLNQRMKDMAGFKSWIDIAVDSEVDSDPNYNAMATTYLIQVDSMIRDDLTSDTFYKAIRMAGVMKDVMIDYMENIMPDGMMYSEVNEQSLPLRVKAESTKLLRSGVTYLLIIQ